MIYRPTQIGAFEFAVLAARRAEQLRRGCVPRVEGGHKLVVTAQLEVIAGRVVRAVEGTARDLPDAAELTEAPAALCAETPRVADGVRPEVPTRVGLAAAEMVPTGPLNRGEVS